MAIYSTENITKIVKLSHHEYPCPKSQKYLYANYTTHTVLKGGVKVTNQYIISVISKTVNPHVPQNINGFGQPSFNLQTYPFNEHMYNVCHYLEFNHQCPFLVKNNLIAKWKYSTDDLCMNSFLIFAPIT